MMLGQKYTEGSLLDEGISLFSVALEVRAASVRWTLQNAGVLSTQRLPLHPNPLRTRGNEVVEVHSMPCSLVDKRVLES